MPKLLIIAIGTITFFMVSTDGSCSANLYYVNVSLSPKTTNIRKNVEELAQYYGLNLISIDETRQSSYRNNNDMVNPEKPEAAIVNITLPLSPNALEIIEGIRNSLKDDSPILFVTRPSNAYSDLLNRLSGGAIIGLKSIIEKNQVVSFPMNHRRAFLKEFIGQSVSAKGLKAAHFLLGDKQQIESIMTIAVKDKKGLPFLAGIDGENGPIFFTIAPELDMSPTNSPRINWKSYFLTLLPFMGFIEYSFGEWIWHNDIHLANLTIDDPRLIEPYGFLNYEQLVNNMKNAGFHTSIALIPWNFDRNQQKVIDLFKKNPNLLSIATHGNNHDHYEFYTGAKFSSTQESERFAEDISQATMRMNRFFELTGLTYDRVMVFPHNIGNEQSLAFLKENNFLATFNATNLPLVMEAPKDLFFKLKTYYSFSGLPSVRRFGPEDLSSFDIASHLFLDNPIIYYSHHNYFQNGMDSFNWVPEKIRAIEPDLKWSSLGNIAKNLYLVRKTAPENYEVFAFSRQIILKNKLSKPVKFVVHYQSSENSNYSKKYPPKLWNEEQVQTAVLEAGEEREMTFWELKAPEFTADALSKGTFKIYVLRYLSEFRDTFMWKNPVTRIFVKVYYYTGAYRFGLIIVLFPFVFLGGILFMFILVRRNKGEFHGRDGH